MDSDEHRVMKKLRVEVGSSPSDSDGEGDELPELSPAKGEEPPPMALSHHHPAVDARNSSRWRMLSKQLSMKQTTREAKWEKRRRQILRRSGMAGDGGSLEVRSPVAGERMRCLTDEDLDELRGSIELGFGFDEEKGGADLCVTLPALDLYFAINRQLSDTKLRSTPAASPTSMLSPFSSSSTLSVVSDTPSPRSPHGPSSPADAWTIFTPGDNPQLIKTRLRHWAQVVACSVKHGCS